MIDVIKYPDHHGRKQNERCTSIALGVQQREQSVSSLLPVLAAWWSADQPEALPAKKGLIINSRNQIQTASY